MKIEIRSLTKKYGRLTALDNLTLPIQGGMFGLLGQTGRERLL